MTYTFCLFVAKTSGAVILRNTNWCIGLVNQSEWWTNIALTSYVFIYKTKYLIKIKVFIAFSHHSKSEITRHVQKVSSVLYTKLFNVYKQGYP